MDGKWQLQLLAPVVAVVVGCGYHLAGSGPQSVAHVALPTKVAVSGLAHYDPLYVMMRSVLNRHGVKVVAGGKAVWRLRVQNQKVAEQVALIGTAVGTYEYDLRLDADVQTTRKGKTKDLLFNEKHFTVYGGYPNEPSNPVVSAQRREEALERLHGELCEKILGHLKHLLKKHRRAG